MPEQLPTQQIEKQKVNPTQHSPTENTIVSIQNVCKEYAGGVLAVDDISFNIAQNEFFALLGPSGCGKTTLLRMISGFEVPTSGQIIIDGKDMSLTPPNKRPTNMVFQSYAVFPHMTVEDNVAYGLRVTGVPAAETKKRVAEALEMVKLSHLAKRKPDQMSGGQRQRVALARALVKRPKVLLLDEPLSALDAKLRDDMRMELTRLQKTVGITFIIVTHDQDEALSMATRIAVLDKGAVQQIATPTELYEHPANRFVADFIGRVNLIDTKVISKSGDMIEGEAKGFGKVTLHTSDEVGDTVTMAIRPEKLQLHLKKPAPAHKSVAVRVKDVAYYGDTSQLIVSAPDELDLQVNIQNNSRMQNAKIKRDDQVWITWQMQDAIVLTK